MSSNYDLARAAAERVLSPLTGSQIEKLALEDATNVIADTYAEPMAELEKLRRQVAMIVKKSGPQPHHIGNTYICLLCGVESSPDKPKHNADCPHSEVAK